MLSDGEILALAQALARRQEPIRITCTVLEAWVVFAQLQLVLRHPANQGATADVARAFAEALEAQIASEGLLQMIAREGWAETDRIRAEFTP